MLHRLFAVTALSLVLGTAALAQSSSTGTTSGSGTSAPGTAGSGSSTSGSGMPSGWSGAIGDAFFTESSGSTLRSNDEIRSRWSSLSSEQQAQVRSDCQGLASNTAGTGSTSGTSTGSSSSAANNTTGSSGGWVDTSTTGSTTAGDTTGSSSSSTAGARPTGTSRWPVSLDLPTNPTEAPVFPAR